MIHRIALLLSVGVLLTALGCAGTSGVAVTSAGTGSAHPYLTRGNEYTDQGMSAEAEVCYRAAIRSDRADSRAYVNLAQLYIDGGRIEDAKEVLSKAVKVNPRDVRAHNLLGNICYDRQAYNTARYHYISALTVDPNYYETHWNLIATCFILGKDEEALEHCARYVELAPETEARNIRRARTYISGQRRP